jgi:hypothetical protein
MNATTKTTAQAAATVFACRCSLVTLPDGTGTGCAKLTNRAFAPGHDAKLKSLLGQAQADGSQVTVATPGTEDDEPETTEEVSPLEAAGRFGNFGYMVVEIAAKITAKRDRAAAHKAKLATNKAKREAAKVAKTAKVVKEPATAKVGRWEREGFLVTQKTGEQVFEFAKKSGEIEQVAKFQLV